MVEPNNKSTLLCTIWTEKSYNPDSFRVQRRLWRGDHGFQKNLVLFDWLAKPMERSQIWLNSFPFWIKIGPYLPEFDKKDLLYAIGVTFGGIIKGNHRSLLNMRSCRLSVLDVEGWGMVSMNVLALKAELNLIGNESLKFSALSKKMMPQCLYIGDTEKLPEMNTQQEDGSTMVQRLEDNLQSRGIEKATKMQEEGSIMEKNKMLNKETIY
ncbi:hypothetical protein Godav_026197 [Gossypium davidsonii]|uniref:DUF4283 domain-containing protein n=1 Tax=Gossypium davidsonii TaxID=34287 RepID=A0A7J8RS71_GOSDV|nr:hypothetical protein [Gossypium davidsonii]